jgi:predicted DNA-binding transcriptional regulator AlpA
MQQADPDELLTPEEVSALTKLKARTLANMRSKRTGPAFMKTTDERTGHVRYRRRDVTAWIDGRMVSTSG